MERSRKRWRRWDVFALLFAMAIGCAVTALSSATVLLIAVAIVTAVQLWLIKRRTEHKVPLAGILVAVLNVVAVTGYLFYPVIQQTAQVSAVFPQRSAIYSLALSVFITFSLGVTVGALVVGRAGRPRLGPNRTPNFGVLVTPKNAGLVVLGSTIPLVLLIVGYTPMALIERPHYLYSYGPRAFVSAGSFLTLPALGMVSLALFCRPKFSTLVLGILTATLYVVTLFAMGTRLQAVVPTILVLAAAAQNRLPKTPGPKVITGIVFFVATLYGLSIPLSIRGAGPAGIRPFLAELIEHPEVLSTFGFTALVGNILFAVPLTGFIVTTAHIPGSVFVTSINPLPSGLTDWYAVQPSLGLNRSTPFNGLAEVRAQGLVTTVFFTVLLGALLTWMQNLGSRLHGVMSAAALFAQYGLTLVLALDLLQYNLRTGMRLFWYLVGITLALLLLRKMLRGPTRPSAPAWSRPPLVTKE